MNLICPECHSPHLQKQGPARRAGSIIGTIGGASTGFRSALVGAEIGVTVSRFTGPIGMATGGLVGAIVGGLIGGATGGMAGAALGDSIDEHLQLGNYRCQQCGHCFPTSQ